MFYPEAEFVASSNFSSRRGHRVRMIVLHYTADGGGAVEWFKDPEARASAHFVVGRDGRVVQMVPLRDCAWHAGQRPPRGPAILPNETSVGIEITNWGSVAKSAKGYTTYTGRTVAAKDVAKAEGLYWQRYTARQINALVNLVSWLCGELAIPREFMFEGQPGFTRKGKRYDAVPYYLPSGPEGTNSCLAVSRFKDTAGICGHCHIASGKDDPGPLLPWDVILGKAPA